MTETIESPVTVKAWRIDSDDEWHEIGGYLDADIARAALLPVLRQAVDDWANPQIRPIYLLHIERLAAGEITHLEIGEDRYVLDNPQGRVDSGLGRKCLYCNEITDDTRWLPERCVCCDDERLAEELAALRDRLATFEALRPLVKSWGSPGWTNGHIAEEICTKLAEIFGITES